MPFYVYKCRVCEHIEEYMQKVDDQPPYCERCLPIVPMEKQLTTAHFQIEKAAK